MIRAGLVDADTSHVVQFAKRYNHIDIEQDQWVEGVRIVALMPGKAAPGNEERQGVYVNQLRDWGVKIVEKADELMDAADVVLVESLEGGRHLERARPFIEAGKRIFIDKPFADSIADAEKIIELAHKHGARLMTGSSLRYALEVQELQAKAADTGKVMGAFAYSPSSPLNDIPALVNYGVHGVETLYGIMGGGCLKVSSVDYGAVQTVTGQWRDGRTGVMAGVQKAKGGYGFAAYCEKAVVSREIGTAFIYRELLRKMAAFFETGKPPIPIEQSLEVMRFIAAALESAKAGGREVSL